MRWRKPSASAVFAILMLLSFVGIFLPPGCLSGFRSAVHSFLAPPALGVNHLLRYFAPEPPSWVSGDADRQIAQLYDQIRQLQRENRFLFIQWQQKVNEYAQMQHLRTALLLKEYSLLPANVYSYGPTPGRSVLSIDQGKAAGLQRGFWVVGFSEVTSAGSGWETLARSVLLGRIDQVHAFTADVRLIGDPDDYASPKILAHLYRRLPGAAAQPWRRDEILLEAVPGGLLLARDVPKKNEDGSQTAADDLMDLPVVSAAMKNVPAGLAIGRVVNVSDSPRSMAFWDLTIKPLAGSSRLDSVMVLCPLWPEKLP